MNGSEAVFGWKINNGSWQGVNLEGLSVVRRDSHASTPWRRL